jgi:hypothetical protein
MKTSSLLPFFILFLFISSCSNDTNLSRCIETNVQQFRNSTIEISTKEMSLFDFPIPLDQIIKIGEMRLNSFGGNPDYAELTSREEKLDFLYIQTGTIIDVFANFGNGFEINLTPKTLYEVASDSYEISDGNIILNSGLIQNNFKSSYWDDKEDQIFIDVINTGFKEHYGKIAELRCNDQGIY